MINRRRRVLLAHAGQPPKPLAERAEANPHCVAAQLAEGPSYGGQPQAVGRGAGSRLAPLWQNKTEEAQPIGRLRSALAGGQVIEEDAYAVDFPFDGETIRAIATFVSDAQNLIGANLLRDHALEIGFVSKYVALRRESRP
jgi:hypothetical protein